MKHKLRKVFILYIILAGFLFSCQEEEFYDNHTNSQKVNEYTFKEANQIPTFNKAYHKVINGINDVNNMSRTENLGFVIDSSTIKAVTVANATTYTMRIIRPTTNSTFFENLIINVTTQDSTKAFVTKYTPTEVSQFVIGHEAVSFQGTVEIKEIASNEDFSENKIGRTCIDILVCDWGGTTHLAGEKCGTTRPMSICIESQGGSGGFVFGYGGNSSGTGTAGNTYSSNGGQNPLIVTAPVPPCTRCPTLGEDPCEKLKANTSSFDFKKKFAEINNEANFRSVSESGFYKKINSLGQTIYQNGIVGPSFMRLVPGAVSGCHVHNDQLKINNDGYLSNFGTNIHSDKDLTNLLVRFRQNAVTAGMSPLDVQSIVISRDGIFALTIIDNNFSINDVNSLWPKFLLKYMKEAYEISNNLNLSVTQRQDKLKIMMLEGLKILGLENNIALFQGTVTNSMSTTSPSVPLANLSWSRIILNTTGSLEAPINCN